MKNQKAVFGLADNEAQVDRIIDHLLAAGFSSTDISVLSPDRPHSTKKAVEGGVVYEKTPGNQRGGMTTEIHSKAPEGATTGAITGGLLGGGIGLLAGIGSLAIPGLGALVAAGPIMAALSGSAVGGATGLLIGSLIGYGVPEMEAKRYEEEIKNGMTLISVHTDSEKEAERAKEILKKDGAKDITSTCEK